MFLVELSYKKNYKSSSFGGGYFWKALLSVFTENRQTLWLASAIATRKGRLSYSQYAQVSSLETGLDTLSYRAKQVYVLSMGGGSETVVM